ncbi:MAG TPA: guanylate kinase [Smithellaceae bacterium]|nr:guanylate kinase [Smithellaceae bacterium]
MMPETGLFIVVSAPSGAGKSSLCRRLLEACPKLRFSTSFTSRPPRPNEVSGKDYHFVTREDFQARIERGEFVEWVENFGHFYGTSGKAMTQALQSGGDLLLDIEPRGAKAVKRAFDDGVFVFILPPSLGELRRRLETRGHETQAVIDRRFAQARSELAEIGWYDYVIVNDDLDAAAERLKAIYMAEQCKTNRLRDSLKQFMNE